MRVRLVVGSRRALFFLVLLCPAGNVVAATTIEDAHVPIIQPEAYTEDMGEASVFTDSIYQGHEGEELHDHLWYWETDKEALLDAEQGGQCGHGRSTIIIGFSQSLGAQLCVRTEFLGI